MYNYYDVTINRIPILLLVYNYYDVTINRIPILHVLSVDTICNFIGISTSYIQGTNCTGSSTYSSDNK